MLGWQESLLAGVDSAQADAADTFKRIKEAGLKLGLDYVCYGIRVPMPMAPPEVLILSNYAQGWLQRYERERYVEIDPTVAHAVRSQTPVLWSAVQDVAPSFWEDAHSFDLRHGWAQSTLDGTGSAGVFSVGRGSEPISGMELGELEPQLRWLASFSHLALFHRVRGELLQRKQLSGREVEVLKWAAAGKTNDEIGSILRIACDTVKFHLKNASHKLNCVNKTQAVVQAALLGLLA